MMRSRRLRDDTEAFALEVVVEPLLHVECRFVDPAGGECMDVLG